MPVIMITTKERPAIKSVMRLDSQKDGLNMATAIVKKSHRAKDADIALAETIRFRFGRDFLE